jgi:KipI family sensor histidine kinase inhibitor
VTALWRAGDAALLVDADGVAARLATAIGSSQLPGVLDIVPGARTVLIVTEPGSWDLADLAQRILALPLPDDPRPDDPRPDGGRAEIPVIYDGPDLTEVAELTGLTVTEVIARHQAAEYRVGWLGFSPGFGYLTGLDPALAQVPRLATPRLSVPAGSVAIAGGIAAVYPAASPGGWRLVGRTTARMWDPTRDPPALLAPGMRVRFRAVLPEAGAEHPAEADPAKPPSADPVPPAEANTAGTMHAASPTRIAATTAVHDPGVFTSTEAQKTPGSWTGSVEIVRPGPLATIQDLGRTGYAHLGVPRSGAADTASLRRANRLVGNADGAAGLEFTLGRAELRFHSDAVVAVTGAVAVVTVAADDGTPQEARSDSMLAVPAGSVLRLGAPVAGLRSYLTVRGGLDVPAVLGSRSADLTSGLGPRPLRAGDRLPVGAEAVPGGPDDARTAPDGRADAQGIAGGPVSPGMPAGPDAVVDLRVLAGPRDDWFDPMALQTLTGQPYRVTPASNRTGLRLAGPVLARARTRELPSEGMVSGAIEVPHDGQPILMLADHPVTGGYPVIAVVHSADVSAAAQLRPGQRVRFVLAATSPLEATGQRPSSR